ncbi:Pvc16 family protein [Streptomyces sp. NPDC051555]|uniref:Pvc16 family protein n=1 Tax=Streptomyces sp. NPDC051555 TaxID=3365657 RepID=UPI0037BAB39F
MPGPAFLIQGVDQALKAQFDDNIGSALTHWGKRDPNNPPPSIEVNFNEPNDGGHAISVSVFLYRIREHLDRRQNAIQTTQPPKRQETPKLPTVSADDPSRKHSPSYFGETRERWIELSYMVTGTGTDPNLTDPTFLGSHFAIQMALETVWELTSLQVNVGVGQVTALVTVNQPSEDARSAAELWTALSIKPRPFFDLSVLCPFRTSPTVAGSPIKDVNLGLALPDGTGQLRKSANGTSTTLEHITVRNPGYKQERDS